MSEEKYDKSFQVNNSAMLSLSNICGSVEVLPGVDDIIQVTAIKQTHTGDWKRTEIEIHQEADGTVRADTHFPDGSWSWLFGSRPCNVDYLVRVQQLCSIKINSVSSTVSIKEIQGSCDVKSVSGDIELHDVSGAMQIQTISGRISGEHNSGSIDLDTISGDVLLKDSSLSAIYARTVSGNIQILTPLKDGPYLFKSISGDVHLTVPSETHCTAELHSVSGNLISTFPILGYSRNHGIQTIKAQGGGVNVTLNSVSGNLSLASEGKSPRIPDSTASPSLEDRHKVLEGIASGTLTVEEGLTKLKG